MIKFSTKSGAARATPAAPLLTVLHVVTVLTFVCLFSVPPGGQVWEANMEETGGGCGGPRWWQQLCFGPDNSKRAPWCVAIATPPYSISTSLVLDHVKSPGMSYTHSCYSLEAMCMSHL